MPKKKKTNNYSSKSAMLRALFIGSIALNIGFLAFLLIVWGLWDTGGLNDNEIQTSLCHNFYMSIQNGMNMDNVVSTGKSTTIGNVTFIDTKVTPSILNSPCWLESQALNFVNLTQINNSQATSYYLNQTNFHAPSGNNQYKIPLYINSKTNQATVYPY